MSSDADVEVLLLLLLWSGVKESQRHGPPDHALPQRSAAAHGDGRPGRCFAPGPPPRRPRRSR
eukprot:2212316-Rhodomonas_salina.3